MRALRHSIPALFAVIALLGACSQSGSPPPQPQADAKAAREAQAQQKLTLYQSMLASHRDDLAAPIGEEIVKDFGDTAAAAAVEKTLPQIEAAAKATVEHDRLANLWTYQTATQSGATQHTASIVSSKPTGDAAVQLILRRHAKWGQSVYLFGSGHGFVCKDLCNVAMRFDGKSGTWKAYLPKTGEPALFIKDDPRFIAAMQRAKAIEMEVDTRDQGKETLQFEVGGFDPGKLPPLSKH